MTEAAEQILLDAAGIGKKPEIGKLRWFCRYVIPWLWLFVGLVVIPGLYQLGMISIETVNRLGLYMAFAIVAVGLDLVWGYTGVLCLCQSFFFALGGYAMGMYLAHHGGPEGKIDVFNWGKIPTCMFRVYPADIGQPDSEWFIPFFWKPFWSLPLTLMLGLLIPGLVAFLIGYLGFRSRVRGVFFAILTQTITFAAWQVFSDNDRYLCGTNGLIRFDHVIFSSREKIEVNLDHERLAKFQLGESEVWQVVSKEQEHIEKKYEQQVREKKEIVDRIYGNPARVHVDSPVVELFKEDHRFLITIARSLHVWNTKEDFESLVIMEKDEKIVHLNDVADVDIVGYDLTDSKVQVALYLITVLALAIVYVLCRAVVKSKMGRVLIAIRDNETRLRFSGYEPYQFKVFAFTLAGMIAGLGGMLYVPQKLTFTPRHIEVPASILMVVWVAVGGRGNLSGAILGTLVVNLSYYYLTSVREPLSFLEGIVPDKFYDNILIWQPKYWLFVLGGLFIGVVLLLPNGLISLWHRLIDVLERQSDGKATESDRAIDGNGEEASEASSDSDHQERLSRLALLTRSRSESQLEGDLLRVENITVLFDGFKALDIEEFSVPFYGLQVIIGPNGAGKTTLCDVISGKTRPTTGKVFFGGHEITTTPEVEIARLGIGRKFQTPTIFDGLSVYQNMALSLPGRQKIISSFGWRESSEERGKILGVLKRVHLIEERNKLAKYISHGQRQWLEISMLILSDPRLLLVDEPAAGLTDEESILTAELLLELQTEHSIIVIEHDMEFVRLLDSKVTVLNEGLIMAQGTMQEVSADPRVIEAYLGR